MTINDLSYMKTKFNFANKVLKFKHKVENLGRLFFR